MVSAMTTPTAKKAAAVPTRMAPSRSTDTGMNGCFAVIMRHANKHHSVTQATKSARICGEPQA